MINGVISTITGGFLTQTGQFPPVLMIGAWIVVAVFGIWAISYLFAKLSSKIILIMIILFSTYGMAFTFNSMYIPLILPLENEFVINNGTINQTTDSEQYVMHVYPDKVDYNYTAYARNELDNLIWIVTLFWDRTLYHSINAREWVTPFGMETAYTLFGTSMAALAVFYIYVVWKLFRSGKVGYVSPILAMFIFFVVTGFASGIRRWVDGFSMQSKFLFYIVLVAISTFLVAIEWYRREEVEVVSSGG